jgi:hypothetical protein
MLVSNGRNPLGVVTLDNVLTAVVGTASVPASGSTVG